MKRTYWKILWAAALVILAAVLIFAPWPKDESPDPAANGVGGPAFSTPVRSGYGAANPFR